MTKVAPICAKAAAAPHTREQIALDAAKAYIALKRYEALVTAAGENVSVHQHFVSLADERSQGGIADSTEVQLANVNLGEAQSGQEDMAGFLRAANSAYLSKVGVPAGRLADVPDLKLDLSSLGDLDKVAADAPAVQMAKAREAEARHAVDAEKASLYPRLAVETYYKDGSDYTGKKAGIGVRLTGPTFTGLSNFQRVESMRYAVETSQWTAEAARRDAALKVKEFIDRAPTLQSQIKILAMQQEKAKALRTLYESQFKLGDRNLIDLINVQADVTRIEKSKINARFDILDLQYGAAAALGRLEEQLGIAVSGVDYE